MIIAFPIGILSGIYVNEYAHEGKLKQFIKMMTNNLAGIPSIVFGLFGMALFVNKLNFRTSIIAGSLTLALLALFNYPDDRRKFKAVDSTFRHASYALGFETIYHS